VYVCRRLFGGLGADKDNRHVATRRDEGGRDRGNLRRRVLPGGGVHVQRDAAPVDDAGQHLQDDRQRLAGSGRARLQHFLRLPRRPPEGASGGARPPQHRGHPQVRQVRLSGPEDAAGHAAYPLHRTRAGLHLRGLHRSEPRLLAPVSS
jgi:hypothetical protein